MNTIIEKIRAEVERLYNDKSYSEDRWDMGYDCACEDIMSFLSTLESEKPIPTDLESYAQKIEDYYDVGEERGYLCVHRGGVKEAVIAGAKWHAEQIWKSPLVSVNNSASEELQRINYENGKKDMREQMMKEAVEGEIQMRYSGCLCAKTIRAINEDKFKLGDKVRLIIVKED